MKSISTSPSALLAHSRSSGSCCCRSEYQNLPLHSVEELRQLAESDTPPKGLELPLPEGESEEELHQLMLVRLAFELAERKRSVAFHVLSWKSRKLSLSTLSDRFEEDRKTLGLEKAKLVKENQVKKSRLEELEKQLTEFVDVSLLFLSLDP